jgi:hypothetical protein
MGLNSAAVWDCKWGGDMVWEAPRRPQAKHDDDDDEDNPRMWYKLMVPPREHIESRA